MRMAYNPVKIINWTTRTPSVFNTRDMKTLGVFAVFGVVGVRVLG